MCVLISVSKCSLSLVKSIQLALLQFICECLWPLEELLVCVVVMIEKWSDPKDLATFHDFVDATFGEQKRMSGDDGLKGAQ